MYNLSNLSKEELELLDECLDLWHDFVFAPGPDQAELDQEKKLHEKIQKLLGINKPHE